MEETLDRKNLIVMKLLHYFITEKNYNPIILQGAENEIWLENMDSDYKIIRIVSNHIHNEEQFDFDILKTKHIMKKIKRKTFSLNMNAVSIFTDLSEDVNVADDKNINCISIYDEKDIEKCNSLIEKFPDINNKLKFSEEGVKLFVKITSDINQKNKKDQKMVEDIFTRKKPTITYILIGLNILIYVFMIVTNQYNSIINKYAVYGPYIVNYNQYYRLITGAFLHANVMHLAFNCYALYVVGSQIESFMGKTKYITIYIYSAVIASLLSILCNSSASVGASGAVFGLMGALLYFGYHYRIYLGNVVRSQIIPLILVNLLIGFLGQGIDNFAHIGGLIGGIIITIGIGVKYKSSKFEMINGIISSIILVGILLFLSYKFI